MDLEWKVEAEATVLAAGGILVAMEGCWAAAVGALGGMAGIREEPMAAATLAEAA